MKLLFTLLLILAGLNFSISQCNFPSSSTSIPKNINSTTPVFMFSGVSGLFHTPATGVIAGVTYRFTFIQENIFHRYITIRTFPQAGSSVLAHGQSPLTWTATTTANITVHWSKNVSCDGDIFDHTGTGVRLTPLPISIKDFSGRFVPKTGVEINLTTAQEVNNDKIILERAIDANQFTTIETVDGQGNSSSETNYTFIDENPNNGNNYYRIKQIDYDGTSTYSDVISVNVPAKYENRLELFKISNNRYKLKSVKNTVDVEVFNINGQKIMNKIGLRENDEIDLQELNAGMYIIRLNDNFKSMSHKVTIEK